MDSATARLQDARTILHRAALDMAEGEARARVQTAIAACSDALEAHSEIERLKGHLEVLADALAAPGKGSE